MKVGSRRTSSRRRGSAATTSAMKRAKPLVIGTYSLPLSLSTKIAAIKLRLGYLISPISLRATEPERPSVLQFRVPSTSSSRLTSSSRVSCHPYARMGHEATRIGHPSPDRSTEAKVKKTRKTESNTSAAVFPRGTLYRLLMAAWWSCRRNQSDPLVQATGPGLRDRVPEVPVGPDRERRRAGDGGRSSGVSLLTLAASERYLIVTVPVTPAA